eukprot:TRINITY_DN2582_c0_g1_i4.p1 TRINITY_DN2582_c0_g1~~TRINITY_DN2582_c0_g1_i4.p1  ORF type:complete len:339 (-),score=87.65 TRINITY_DN2582_c0_g1_i4:68-1084(-)
MINLFCNSECSKRNGLMEHVKPAKESPSGFKSRQAIPHTTSTADLRKPNNGDVTISRNESMNTFPHVRTPRFSSDKKNKTPHGSTFTSLDGDLRTSPHAPTMLQNMRSASTPGLGPIPAEDEKNPSNIASVDGTEESKMDEGLEPIALTDSVANNRVSRGVESGTSISGSGVGMIAPPPSFVSEDDIDVIPDVTVPMCSPSPDSPLIRAGLNDKRGNIQVNLNVDSENIDSLLQAQCNLMPYLMAAGDTVVVPTWDGACWDILHVFHETTCCICWMDFEEEAALTALPCGHIFHPECIDDWLRNSTICPLCRHSVTEERTVGETSDLYPLPLIPGKQL